MGQIWLSGRAQALGQERTDYAAIIPVPKLAKLEYTSQEGDFLIIGMRIKQTFFFGPSFFWWKIFYMWAVSVAYRVSFHYFMLLPKIYGVLHDLANGAPYGYDKATHWCWCADGLGLLCIGMPTSDTILSLGCPAQVERKTIFLVHQASTMIIDGYRPNAIPCQIGNPTFD